MTDTGWCVFDSPLGSAGLAWTERGICGIELPDPDRSRVQARLRRRFPHASESQPSPDISRTIDLIAALLRGEQVDLSSVQLDLESILPFESQVYSLARAIPVGETATYGDIARGLGDVHLARDVGQALARNPFPIVVPCHRVIAADGRLGGFSARGGVNTKQRLLAIERANANYQLALDLSPPRA